MPPKSPLPQWIPTQLTQPVETAPSGPQWVHEIKLDGFRMSARIDKGTVRLLTRTGLDWSGKYPAALAALKDIKASTAYLDGELCGVGDDGLPSFAETQAATDGARGIHLVFTPSTSCIWTAATREACPLSNARRFWGRL